MNMFMKLKFSNSNKSQFPGSIIERQANPPPLNLDIPLQSMLAVDFYFMGKLAHIYMWRGFQAFVI